MRKKRKWSDHNSGTVFSSTSAFDFKKTERNEPLPSSMYKFKKAHIPPALDIPDIMAAQQGSESRFGSRFIKYAGTSETFTRSADLTGSGINDLRSYAGMINEQKKGIDRMFLLSEKAVLAISELEKMSGVRQVDNIPVPSDIIRTSYGKKMGYTSLTMSFLSEGLLHFMEETVNLQAALESRDRTISALAANIPQMEVLGKFEEVTLNDLNNHPPTDLSAYTKPPVSPQTNGSATQKKGKK